MRRRIGTALAVALLGAPLATLPVASGAQAGPAHPTMVSTNPVDWTPHVLDGTVWAIAVVGETVVVGGDFTTVTDSAGANRVPRRYLFAYGLRDGRILPWAPTVDRPVYTLTAGPDNTVYVGGWFLKVNGAAQRGVARISLVDGSRTPGFNARINWGDVRALAVVHGSLYIGGTFTAINGVPRVALARVNAVTGALDTGFDARLAAPGMRRARVEDFAVTADGRRLVVIGAIRSAGGVPRNQLAVLHISGPGAVVLNWHTDTFNAGCMAGFDTYLRGVDFSPAGDYFVVVATGRATGPTLPCDAAMRFDLAGVGLHRPVWVNRTGGDSLYSVSVTGPAVYVGGHQRWMNNAYGKETAGPGAVARSGVAALNPVNGLVLPWNPGKSRGVGTQALVASSAGLFIGSDTETLAGERHARLGHFPLP
ncbi:delta-60 repeat domain-containing protein [Pilimelia columellifera]|uniref:Uncharacterized protein n=1 Tax=Pilimelia columellifera subsp. columellifera TaxID=706583 RepID=A0ABN3NQT4_9ACTN